MKKKVLQLLSEGETDEALSLLLNTVGYNHAITLLSDEYKTNKQKNYLNLKPNSEYDLIRSRIVSALIEFTNQLPDENASCNPSPLFNLMDSEREDWKNSIGAAHRTFCDFTENYQSGQFFATATQLIDEIQTHIFQLMGEYQFFGFTNIENLKPFEIGIYRIPQIYFKKFWKEFKGNTLLYNPDEDLCPVDFASWEHATDFCNWLSREKDLEEVYSPIFEELEIPIRVRRNMAVVGEIKTIHIKNTLANINKNGYRLPTDDELDIAISEGVIKDWDVSKEWCNDSHKNRAPDTYRYEKITKGGDPTDPKKSSRDAPDKSELGIAFRLARTLQP